MYPLSTIHAAARLGCKPEDMQVAPFVYRATLRNAQYATMPGGNAPENNDLLHDGGGVLVVERTYMEFAKTSPMGANLIMAQIADESDSVRQIPINEGYQGFADTRPGTGDGPPINLHTVRMEYVSVHDAATARLSVFPAEAMTDTFTYFHILIIGNIYQKKTDQ